MKKIVLFALLLRISLAPFFSHGDTHEYLNWGKSLYQSGTDDFYFRDTADAEQPNYPPGFYYILLINQFIYEAVRDLFWQINLTFDLFPSNLFLWLDSDKGRIFFNKLPAILADVGIGYLIYLFVKEFKDPLVAKLSASAFLFSPPIWYNSAVWGSTESLFSLPLFASFYAIYKKKTSFAPVFFTISFLIKPTVLLALPILGLWLIRQWNPRKLIGALIISAILFYLSHIPFHPQDTAFWIVKLYRDDIREILGYLTANAFNFWGLIFGFAPRPDSTLFLGIPAYFWSFGFFGFFILYFFKSINRKSKAQAYLFGTALLVFAAFLFLTRMHERYFYLTIPFLATLVGLDRNIQKAFWLVSGVHFINLYHFWWVPPVDGLINFFSSRQIEQALIVINMAVFIWLFNIFRREYAKN